MPKNFYSSAGFNIVLAYTAKMYFSNFFLRFASWLAGSYFSGIHYHNISPLLYTF